MGASFARRVWYLRLRDEGESGVVCSSVQFLLITDKFEMALLKEDAQYTHVVAIDFGTGASGLFAHQIWTLL